MSKTSQSLGFSMIRNLPKVTEFKSLLMELMPKSLLQGKFYFFPSIFIQISQIFTFFCNFPFISRGCTLKSESWIKLEFSYMMIFKKRQNLNYKCNELFWNSNLVTSPYTLALAECHKIICLTLQKMSFHRKTPTPKDELHWRLPWGAKCSSILALGSSKSGRIGQFWN